MRKYYVNWGKHATILTAANPIHACILVFQRIIGQQWVDEFDLPTTFKVSERGFEDHNDDEKLDTLMVLKLLMLSNHADADEDEVHELDMILQDAEFDNEDF